MDTRKVRSAMVWLLLSAAVIAIDQGSKAWVLTHLPEYTPVPVIDGLWNWYRSYNTGAAFSLLSDAGGWQQVFFSVLAMVVSVALGIALKRLPRADWRQAAPYGSCFTVVCIDWCHFLPECLCDVSLPETRK